MICRSCYKETNDIDISTSICWECGHKIKEREKEEKKQHDMVYSPSHYAHGHYETIQEMLIIFGMDTVAKHCICTAYKYKARSGHKWNELEDLQKADWYLRVGNFLQEYVGNNVIEDLRIFLEQMKGE